MNLSAAHSSPLVISALGERLNVVNATDTYVTVRTRLRLCPGRQISYRLGGAQAGSADILSSTVCRLGDDGAEYLVSLAIDAARRRGAETANAAVAGMLAHSELAAGAQRC
jgi:hypothetical protein